MNNSYATSTHCTFQVPIFLLALWFLLGVVPSSCAWGYQLGGGPTLSESSGLANKYRDLKRLIRKNEQAVSELYGTMPLGFPKEQAEHLRKIDELKAQTEALTAQLDQAAIDSFQAAPAENPDAVKHVFQLIVNKLDGKGTKQFFDPVGALELIDGMIKADINAAPVLYQGFRASNAIQDYDRAKMFLKKIEKEGEKLEDKVWDDLDDLKSKWQQEVSLRNQETGANDLPQVKFVTTAGEFTIELFENQAPETVANFISLVENRFYDGLIFHVVQPGRFAQTGCPLGNGKGNPGYRIANETDRPVKRNFFAGTLGMVHKGADSAGSQFFIAYQTNLDYNKDFVAFGRIIEGLDSVYSLRPADRSEDDSIDKRSRVPITGEPSQVISATVIRKRAHDYQPVKLPNPSDTPESNLGGLPTDNQIPDVSPKLDK